MNLARGWVFDGGSTATPSVITWQHVVITWRHVVIDLLLAAAGAGAVALPAAFTLWQGTVGRVGVTAPSVGALPALLVVLLCLVMVALLRRARTVRNLLRRY